MAYIPHWLILCRDVVKNTVAFCIVIIQHKEMHSKEEILFAYKLTIQQLFGT